jgi:hypothetical protein
MIAGFYTFRRGENSFRNKPSRLIPSYAQSVLYTMQIIAFIEDPDVIKKILKHFDPVGCGAKPA